jgi:hypothetical protein
VNERIMELASCNERIQTFFETGPVQRAAIEQFAELIVRECVRYFNEDYQRDFDTLWREDLSKGIKEYFGVEE